MGYQG